MGSTLLSTVIYSCRQATLLSEKKAEGKISFVEQLQLSIHTLNCSSCRRFIRQYNELRQLLRETPDFMYTTPIAQFTDSQKTRLQQAIDEAVN